MKVLLQCLAIGAAGSVGSMLRWGVGIACKGWFGSGFPIGTFLINITGSMFLGWFLTIIDKRPGDHETMRLAIAVGFVGAYTTFSTYMYESNSLLREGSELKAFAYLGGSIFFGLLAVRVGMWLAGR